MKFNEWLEKLEKQQKRLHDCSALSDVVETINVQGTSVTIEVGKEGVEVCLDNANTRAKYPPRQLRSIYTNNKEEFGHMLATITERTAEVVVATEAIMEALADGVIPEAVMLRLSGEKVSGESTDLVTESAGKKLEQLHEEFYFDGYTKIQSFRFDDIIAGKDLILTFDAGSTVKHIQWGDLSANSRFGSLKVEATNVEDCMFFLANYELIKEKLLSVIAQVKAIQ